MLVGVNYLAFGGFGAVLAYILLPLRLLGIRDPRARTLAAQDLMHVWMRRYFVFARALGVVRSTYPPPLSLGPGDGPAVIIANHPSLLDVVFVMGAIPRVTSVAKNSWMRSPLVGRMLRACGHISGPRGNTAADGAITLERMIEGLRAGNTLLVFPEGTRSPKGGLWPFQRGAFEAAVRTRSPIVQCVLDVDPPMLRKDQPWYDVADRIIEYRMQVLPMITPDALGTSSKALAAATEARYREALGLTAPRAENERSARC